MFESKEALKALQAWATLCLSCPVHLSIWDPGHQVELSGVKVQQKELKDQCGIVWSGSVTSGYFSSLAIKKHQATWKFRTQSRTHPKVCWCNEGYPSLQNRSRTKQLSMRLLLGCGIDLSSDFPGDFNLFWHSLTYDGFVGLKPCLLSLGVSNIECRVGLCISVHIVRLLPVLSSKEFMPVQSGRTQGQQELLRKIQHSCCNDWLNLVSYDLTA